MGADSQTPDAENLKPGEVDARGLANLYAVLWVPAEARSAWVLDACICDPQVQHCERCDARRLMVAMVRQYVERRADRKDA